MSSYPLNRLEALQMFFDYIENDTELYKLDTLGMPWYSIARDRLVNASIPTQTRKTGGVIESERQRHFASVLPLLEGKFEYIFFSRSKMRGWAPDQVENPYFIEMFDWLAERDIPFLVLESPEGDAGCDRKMIFSRHAHCTIPHDLLVDHVGGQLVPQIEATVAEYYRSIEQLISIPRESNKFDQLVKELFSIYIAHAEFIPRTVVNQALVNHLNAKVVVGGMGSHLAAGARNAFAVVEMHHGYLGKFDTLWKIHLPVRRYFEERYFLNRYFNLVPSVSEAVLPDEPICRLENQLAYGMPDLRTWKHDSERLSELKARLGVGPHPVVLIAISGWVNADELKIAIDSIVAQFPDVKILLRPHPTYDLLERHSGYPPQVALVSTEHKYDLFSIADIIISSRSSMAVEASCFSNNIIVVGDDVYRSFVGRRALAAMYPFAKVTILNAREELCSMVGQFIEQGSTTTIPSCTHDLSETLETLHRRILESVSVQSSQIEIARIQ